LFRIIITVMEPVPVPRSRVSFLSSVFYAPFQWRAVKGLTEKLLDVAIHLLEELYCLDNQVTMKMLLPCYLNRAVQ